MPTRTAPAQLELYSTKVALSSEDSSPDLIMGCEERVRPPRLDRWRARRLSRRFSVHLAPRAASAQRRRLTAALNFILATCVGNDVGWRAGSGKGTSRSVSGPENVDESWGGLGKTQSREPSKRWSLKSLLYHHRRYGAIDQPLADPLFWISSGLLWHRGPPRSTRPLATTLPAG